MTISGGKPTDISEDLLLSEEKFHSVRLDEDKCKGCTNCIKRCPTQAIRVRNGKAVIINERCIDCGECIRACANGAKQAVTDSLDDLKNYSCKIAMPAPALYSQYRSARTRNHLLTALKRVGFDDVFEVASGAEAVSNASREYLKKDDLPRPVISTACPAIVKLIQVKFPNFIENLLPLQAPVEVAARMAREKAVRTRNLKPEDIGIFFISPCAAKMTTKYFPFKGSKSDIDEIISFQDIYMPLRKAIREIGPEEEEDLASASIYGVRWPNPGGESLALDINKFIAVDGIHDVVNILETIENNDENKFRDIDFMECLACKGGCLGGPLAVKNVYMAQVIMKAIRSEQGGRYKVDELPHVDVKYSDIQWDRLPEHVPVDKLDSDIVKAFSMMEQMEGIIDGLPGIDCGACGAPTCRALAEDIVRGNAKITDCIFKLREKVRELADEMFELEGVMPPTMERDSDRNPAGSGQEGNHKNESR